MSALRCRREGCACVVPVRFPFSEDQCSKCAHTSFWHRKVNVSHVGLPAGNAPLSPRHHRVKRLSKWGHPVAKVVHRKTQKLQAVEDRFKRHHFVTIWEKKGQKRVVHFFRDGALSSTELIVGLYTPQQSLVYELECIENRETGEVLRPDRHHEIACDRLTAKAEYIAHVHDMRERALHNLGVPHHMEMTVENLYALHIDPVTAAVEAFMALDVSHSGEISMEDLRRHYAQHAGTEEGKQGRSRIDGATCKSDWHTLGKTSTNRAVVTDVDAFMAEAMLSQFDVTKSTTITLREFMLAQAHVYTRGLDLADKQRLAIEVHKLQHKQKVAQTHRERRNNQSQLRSYRARNPVSARASATSTTRRRAKKASRTINTSRRSKSKKQQQKPKSRTAKLQIPKMLAEFKRIDTNHDGKITSDELEQLMIRLGEDSVHARQHALGFFRLADVEKQNAVDFKHFVKEYARMQVYHAVMFLKDNIEIYDDHHTASLTKLEVLHALTDCMGATQAKIQLDSIFHALDADHNGTISLSELEYWHFPAKHKVRSLVKKSTH